MKSNKQKSSFLTKMLSAVLIYSFVLTNMFAIQVFANTTNQNVGTSPTLTQYTTDLTELARNGRLRLNANFESETNRLIKMLATGGLRQPVILDEKGENQELVVEQMASRIAAGDVPANLRDKRLLKLETATLFSNAKNDVETSQIIESIFNELTAQHGEVILFVDELTNFVGSSPVNNALTNALLEGKVKIIGGTSKVAYSEKINDLAEVAALFELINIGETQYNNQENSTKRIAKPEGFRGDNVAPDLRQMMSEDRSGKKRVDVIIQAKDADNQVLRAIMAENRVILTDRIGESDTLVVSLPLSAVDELSQSGLINYMSPNRDIQMSGHVEDATGVTLTRSQPAVTGRAAYTLDGSGIGVAIVDSGIYAAHNGFKNGATSRIVANVNFTNSNINDTADTYGHGTHVAGLAVGSASVSSNAYKGVASNANIISVKVLDGNGVGQTAWLLSGLNWILTNKTAYNIRVVNLSLGGIAVDTYTNDPVCRKVKELTDSGIVVVAASGNLGRSTDGTKAYGRIHSPGNSPYAITVGASNTVGTTARGDDSITSYSSRGPTRSFYTDAQNVRHFDNLVKPDIVAPGNRLVSNRAVNNLMATQNPGLVDVTLSLLTTTDGMMYMSGTSMSSPVVTGAAALLLQVNPNLTPNMVKMILQYTAQPIVGANSFEQGAGQLNMEGAVRLAKSFNPSMNFQTATNGASIVPTSWVAPTPTSSIGGSNVAWSQMITTNYAFITGQSLISKYQGVYALTNNFDAK